MDKLQSFEDDKQDRRTSLTSALWLSLIDLSTSPGVNQLIVSSSSGSVSGLKRFPRGMMKCKRVGLWSTKQECRYQSARPILHDCMWIGDGIFLRWKSIVCCVVWSICLGRLEDCAVFGSAEGLRMQLI